MQLLRTLTQLQHDRGWLSDETLRELSEEQRVPLFRLEELVSFYTHFRRTPPPKTVIHVCRDVCCAMANSEEIFSQIQRAESLGDDVEVCEVSCLGRCDTVPAIAINDKPVIAADTWDVDLLCSHLGGESNEKTVSAVRWECDPYSLITDSSASDSEVAERYGTVRSLVRESLERNDAGLIRQKCVAELTEAGLLGMGGAGFPVGRKWELVAGETSATKYVICNADESEPGTFKDRAILAGLSHLVIEGMLLAGLTIGAEHGIVFIRHEYEPEREKLAAEIAAAYSAGVLGENACGSGRRFDLEIFVSPGGYILGEETALLQALEDRRGEPQNKPPYPGTRGLRGKPTLINNVESFAWATCIVHRGADWWNGEGVNGSRGRKFVSISGDVSSPGVFEIPLGLPVSELIAMAGGMRDGKSLLAFLPGGASSKFLPADKVETSLDFTAMKEVGSMLGTGAVIVMAEGRDLFALATNLVRFFRNESCGKCVPCRLGSDKAVRILEKVQAGTADAAALEILPELGETLEQTSICGLGQVALNPILSMLEHFPFSG